MALDSIAKRIKWAREHRGYQTPTEAADAFGFNRSTYYGYENGDRVPGRKTAIRIGRAYCVRWEWLLEGEGNPTRKLQAAKISGRISGSIVHFYPNDKIINTAELPPGGTSSTIALEVLEGSMLGIADDGWLIYFDHEHRPPTAALHEKLCVVELDDGAVFLKVLQPGRKNGCYDLEPTIFSPTEKTMRDRRVIWAAKVLWIKPR
jgi:transcriptional regulator with XRE-family HTH domain